MITNRRHVANLEAAVTALRADNERLRTALAQVEWGCVGRICPCCLMRPKEGHARAPDCLLSSALKGAAK